MARADKGSIIMTLIMILLLAVLVLGLSTRCCHILIGKLALADANTTSVTTDEDVTEVSPTVASLNQSSVTSQTTTRSTGRSLISEYSNR